MMISPGGVRSVWLRHDMETMQKRLKALEAKSAQENFILTEAQIAALEKQKQAKQADGQIETEHPGYLAIWLSGLAGHVLRGHAQGCWTHLPADVHRHV